MLSVVSPVYRAELIVEELVLRIEESVSRLTEKYEIILVEDGSPDKTWQKIDAVCKQNPKVKGVKLSRNFGQHYAISAGLTFTAGEWVIVMDCDLQDRPDQIPLMYAKALEGYEIVRGRRHNRKDTFFKRKTSELFHVFLSSLSGTTFDRTVANFGVYHRQVIDEIIKLPEHIRYFPAMINWVGFTHTAVDIEHGERFEGETSYNFSKLLQLALNIILANSDKPLRLTVKIGLYISLFSLMFGIYIIMRWILGTTEVLGYASLIFSIWFIGGTIITMLGVLGLYIAKIFEGVKDRPNFIVHKTLNTN
ncbi:MAG: glycosyltransferase family 2 protein [Chitinophagales bacterium]